MTKRLICWFMAMLLLVPLMGSVKAEEDKDAQIAQLAELNEALALRVQELEAQIRALTEPEPTIEEAPSEYTELKKGSEGDAVVRLQIRLQELKYLGGKADGAFGPGTEGAVKAFQIAAGLSETGIADGAMQTLLYSDEAPVSPNPILDESLYEKLDYKANARDPDAYSGTKIKFSGEIIQVMEDEGYAIFRIATRRGYDDVVYCLYLIPEHYKRFLEDDKVTVYGESLGIHTYETIMGGTVTIPFCMIERIELN